MDRVGSKYLKCLRFTTGVYPIVHTISYIVDSILAINGACSVYPYYMALDASVILGVILLMPSNVFKFCMWHRLLVVNVIVCSILDYVDVLSGHFMDGHIVVYLMLMSSFSFSLGSIISLFFKNKEINGKQ